MPRRAGTENVVRLNKTLLATLVVAAGKSERIVWDEDVAGFGIRIRLSGARSWVIRPPRDGAGSKLHTLAPAGTSTGAIDLANARRLAREKLGEVALGGDPTAAKREARAQASITLASLFETYLAHKEAKGRRSTTISNMRHHLHVHWKPLHDRPLSAITRAEVTARHREIARMNGEHAADRARSILSTYFGWAIREGQVHGDVNPVANTNTATSPTRRDRVLSDVELAAVWQGCRDDDFGRIVRLLILTGLRRNEIAGMRWSELDRAGAILRIPADRMKNRRSHDVPLPSHALEILDAIPERDGRDLIFGEGVKAFSGFSAAKNRLDKRIDQAGGKWTLHDLRRTASTGMNALGSLPHVVEAVLSHVSGARAGVAGIYNRHAYEPEKREALDQWSVHVASIVAPHA